MARLGLGGAIAGGRQYVSWIHERDFARAVEDLVACRKSSSAGLGPGAITDRSASLAAAL
jgi:NAD dependent epimerase/dehydratase family enzyme